MTKPVIYTDKNGFQRRSLVKDTDGESDGEYGIPHGPPDVRQLDWDRIIREINNNLVSAGLFTWNDVQDSQVGITIATSILKRELISLYRETAREAKQNNKNNK